uniref:Fibronectin type-III domain-containing protein n=1 Tax=Terrapene triunguis TaxID=2587831 RepID=A0A674JZ98_9SAUR
MGMQSPHLGQHGLYLLYLGAAHHPLRTLSGSLILPHTHPPILRGHSPTILPCFAICLGQHPSSHHCSLSPGGSPCQQQHLKCDPPFNLQSNISASKCQLWWSVPGPLEPILQYELEYKEHNTSWEQAHHKQLFNAVTKVEIEAMEFEAGITYTARVRCKTSQVEDGYKSQWSEWSQTTEFQRAAPPGAKNVVLFRFVSLYKTERERDTLGNGGAVSSRAKNIFCLNVPTPAAFFQPLYTLHNGNFKVVCGFSSLLPLPGFTRPVPALGFSLPGSSSFSTQTPASIFLLLHHQPPLLLGTKPSHPEHLPVTASLPLYHHHRPLPNPHWTFQITPTTAAIRLFLA